MPMTDLTLGSPHDMVKIVRLAPDEVSMMEAAWRSRSNPSLMHASIRPCRLLFSVQPIHLDVLSDNKL
jgi:hypothetical protein